MRVRESLRSIAEAGSERGDERVTRGVKRGVKRGVTSKREASKREIWVGEQARDMGR